MLDSHNELTESQKDFLKFLLIVLSLLLWIVPLKWAYHAEFKNAVVPADVLLIHKQNQVDQDQIWDLNKVDDQLVIQMHNHKQRYQLALISKDKKDKLSHNDSVRLLMQMHDDKIMHKAITKRIMQLHRNMNNNNRSLWYSLGFSTLTMERRFLVFLMLWSLFVMILFLQMYDSQFSKQVFPSIKKSEESKE